MADINYCYRKNEEIMCKEFTDRFYLVDPYRRVLMELNETAFAVWKLIDGEHSMFQIIEVIARDFAVDKNTAEKDVLKLLKDLSSREVIL